jgi:hypothetical protein
MKYYPNCMIITTQQIYKTKIHAHYFFLPSFALSELIKILLMNPHPLYENNLILTWFELSLYYQN